MISWARVRERFFVDKSQTLCERDALRELWSMSFLSEGDQASSKLCLYVMFAHDVCRVALSPHMSLVLIGEPDEAGLACLEPMDNCLWIQEGPEALHVYSELTEIMSEQYQLGHLMYQIHDHIYHNRGMQAVVDEVADFFGLPVSVMDSAFRFIARSQNYVEESQDLAMRLSPESEALTEQILMMLEQDGLLDQVIASEVPVRVRMRDTVWFVPVFVNHVKTAYLTIYEQRGEHGRYLEEHYEYALPLIGEAVSLEISKGSFYLYNKASYFTYIFSLMLERERVDTDDIRTRLRIFGYDLREKLYLLCIELPYGASSGLMHTTLASTLKDTFRNSIYVNRERMLVFLISRAVDDLPDADEFARWERTLRSTGVLAGFVGPFEGVESVRSRLHLAEQALAVGGRRTRLGVSSGKLFRFEDCQVDALIGCVGDETDVLDYCYAPLMALVEYDQAHNTELVATLREYLRNPKDVAGACDALFIHKNTLYKRLERIRAVMGTDFASAEEIMRIQLTLHILGYAPQGES